MVGQPGDVVDSRRTQPVPLGAAEAVSPTRLGSSTRSRAPIRAGRSRRTRNQRACRERAGFPDHLGVGASTVGAYPRASGYLGPAGNPGRGRRRHARGGPRIRKLPTRSPWAASSRPAAVSLTRLPERSMRVAPVSRSRASSCCETAGGVRCSASAAPATLPCAATACSTPSLRGSIIRKRCFRFTEDNSPLLLYRGGPR